MVELTDCEMQSRSKQSRSIRFRIVPVFCVLGDHDGGSEVHPHSGSFLRNITRRFAGLQVAPDYDLLRLRRHHAAGRTHRVFGTKAGFEVSGLLSELRNCRR